MYQCQKVFQNEEEAKTAANLTIMEILGNPIYQEDEKFDKLLNSFIEQQLELEEKIQKMIKTQIDALNKTKTFMDHCFNNVEKCEQKIEILNQEFDNDSEFHKELVKYEKIFFYRKNIGLMLDQMKYIFRVQEEIDKMNSTFQSGNCDYENLHYKLIALVDIRDNIIEAVNTSPQSKQDLSVILNEFKCLSEFENKFYDKIYEIFFITIEASIKKPQQLIKALQIIETADKSRELRKKELIYKQRTIETIQKGIDEKFNQKLKDAKDAVQILEQSKFSSADLILAFDHTVKCFPKHYEIFQIIEDQYKVNVEKRILPFLEDEQKVTESFGTLINLLSWVDSYEQLLSRVGEQSESYVALRCKVKSYMPIFQDHVNNLIIDYSEKAIRKDKSEQQTLENITKLIKTKQDLLTYFPEDIFHFINQQLDILGPNLKGEIFIEFIRSVCGTLQEVLKKECRDFINEIPSNEQEGEVSPIYLLVLQTNNYYKCMTYSNETKEYCLKFCNQLISERVQQIFYQDLTGGFNEIINQLLEKSCKLVFNEINDQIIPFLFQPKWQNENLIDQALFTIKDYLKDIQLLMLNQIHFNKLVKLIFKQLITTYEEQLLFTVQFIAGIPKGFFPKLLTNLSFVNEQDKDKKKKEKDKKAAIQMILSNKELVVPQMQRDRDVIMNSIEQDYITQVGKTSAQQFDKILTTLIKSINNPKSEMDGLLQLYPQSFESYALYILEVVLWMREDCDSKYKQQKMEILNNLINKK
ncbi:unnamed protein product [Paramecium octaurelia]|uniref:Exocyst complex component Sec6 n=1 Tax=Paramecium octaurelia TaxID=43137 RepID=A0A8S1XMA3_PAROT|nr:unnamed protein product [Paramecium octaurelia]